MDIKFNRVLRDCKWNEDPEKRAARATRGALIYDFDIIINGKKRGEWHKAGFRRGYQLHDASGEKVMTKWRPQDDYAGRQIFADTQGRFLEVTKQWLHILPSDEEIALREQERERAAQEEQRKTDEAARIHRIKEAGPFLLAAAQKALDECCDLIGTEAGNALAAAINKATGEIQNG